MIIIGVDEAGRGPLAGPVVAGAVVLPPGFVTLPDGLSGPGLTDSKKLTARQRDDWYDRITTRARWGIGAASVAEIEHMNILQASLLAMRRAVVNLNFTGEDFEVWVDGNQNPKFENIKKENVKCFIGGDGLHAPISAASVIAKVTRDRMMQDLHARYPHYGWDRNKGYASAAHADAIRAHGPCPEHRALFIRKIYDRNSAAA